MSTPTKVSVMRPSANPSSTPVSKKGTSQTESPGNWRHPRLAEISRRKVTSTFSEKNIRRIAYNTAVLLMLWGTSLLLQQYTPVSKLVSGSLKVYAGYAYALVQVILIVNIGLAMMPLVRKPDDFSDIPLTPGQRQLLGLPASSAPPTSDGVSTPPRYSRTPSISGSVGSWNAAYSGSPLSGRGSPIPASGSPSLSTFPPGPSSTLLQKVIGGSGARRSSFSGTSPFGTTTSSSLFPESPSPSPTGIGKRSSVSLNNKWLYERGRRSSSQNWYS
ncbi:hypothetical protein MKZ38_010554 [Zalerion maritima]|uniref:Nuclear pore complex component n=1 Tax=Zalerion maritima TaxID=339359 RepID=A0AAD5RG96_9PEZI|nr:hypothetical protein MKZ38_010554 [Zalerion maritima]